MTKIHPELRGRVRRYLEGDPLVSIRRAEEILLALDASWALLYAHERQRGPWTDCDLHAVVSLLAGILEADVYKDGNSPGFDLRPALRLRLVEGGKAC